MGCSCAIDVDHDGGAQFIEDTTPTARIEHECYECERVIAKGEKYERTRGCWDGSFSTYKTCLDCKSVREALFCSWMYGEIWEDLRETFFQDPTPPSSECMMALTPAALESVCDLIQSIWDEDDDDDDPGGPPPPPKVDPFRGRTAL